LEFFWKIEKLNSFTGIYIYISSIGAWEQKLCRKISKQEMGGNKFFFAKFDFYFFIIEYSFCLNGKFWFIPFGFVMRKLWTILFFGQLKHLPEKITYRIHFLMQFLQFFKKRSST